MQSQHSYFVVDMQVVEWHIKDTHLPKCKILKTRLTVYKDSTETPEMTKEQGLRFLETIKKTEDKKYVHLFFLGLSPKNHTLLQNTALYGSGLSITLHNL
jgi:hypothetical protein